jgi:hypothetical protein
VNKLASSYRFPSRGRRVVSEEATICTAKRNLRQAGCSGRTAPGILGYEGSDLWRQSL